MQIPWELGNRNRRVPLDADIYPEDAVQQFVKSYQGPLTLQVERDGGSSTLLVSDSQAGVSQASVGELCNQLLQHVAQQCESA